MVLDRPVKLSILTSPIPLKYVGDTGVQSLPCIVGDMVDQGVIIADGRFSDEAVWEGEGAIISPAIPDGTVKTYAFTHTDLSPADPKYIGSLRVDFSTLPEMRYAIISVLGASGGNIDLSDYGYYKAGSVMPHTSRKHTAYFDVFDVGVVDGCFWEVHRPGGGFYLVEAFTSSGNLYMSCDCHDFNEYGVYFARACVHIWRVYMTQAVWEC